MEMKFEVNLELIELLKKSNLTLEEYFIVYSKYFQTGWVRVYRPAEILYNKLIRLNYLTKNRGISKAGRDLIEALASGDVAKIKGVEEHFEEFWKEYPKSDGFAHFKVTSGSKAGSKHTAKIAYSKALQEVNSEILLKGLKANVEAIKRNSLLRGINELTYFVSAKRWLDEETWGIWLGNTPRKVDNLRLDVEIE